MRCLLAEAVPSERCALSSGLQLRSLSINPPLFLAPMAGLTHSALRQIIAGYGGVGLLSTEMLAARRLPTENPRLSPWIIRTDAERPMSWQLLLSGVAEVRPAINALHRLGADAIDLNMGCPAPAVSRVGAGAKLMEHPDEVRRIVAEARCLTGLPLTAKIRLGNELDEGKLRAFCTMLEGEGIDLISVHARLNHESFARAPRWEWVGKIKQWVTIPVIVNGGIFSVEDARNCLQATGADGLMLGRGAVIRPWLFAEIAREIYGCPVEKPVVVLPELYQRFIDLLTELYLPERRLGRLKEFTHYFARNYQFGHLLASKVQSSLSVEEAHERAADFFSRNSSLHE